MNTKSSPETGKTEKHAPFLTKKKSVLPKRSQLKRTEKIWFFERPVSAHIKMIVQNVLEYMTLQLQVH